jgi:hypothetical protein
MIILNFYRLQYQRDLQVPSLRAKTKWEQYARDKGINNRKKDKLVWDLQTKVRNQCSRLFIEKLGLV